MRIPQQIARPRSYWCTWMAQSFSVDRGDGLLDPRIFNYADGANFIRKNLNETLLLQESGWARQPPAAIRGDVFFLIDDGWDVPYAPIERWQFGSHELSPERFPSFTGNSTQRLQRLNAAMRDLGWHGLGLWVAAQVPGDGRDGIDLDSATHEAAWRERLRRSAEAGVHYWKVDWGHRDRRVAFREWLTQLGREEAPDIILEHSTGRGPLNDVGIPGEINVGDGYSGTNSGRYRAWENGETLRNAELTLAFNDVFRSHDVTQHLSTATTLDRIADLLLDAPAKPTGEALLNCEDEVYIGAALGCAVGVMRHQAWLPAATEYDPGHLAQRIGEVVRALRWQRLAPPFAAQGGQTVVSAEVLTDTWRFHEAETWAYWFIGREFQQGAPACIARNIALPRVLATPDGLTPFIVASRHPNGAVAIAALPRTLTDHPFQFPRAAVALDVPEMGQPIGVFGRFASLTLNFPTAITHARVTAQDLSSDDEVDITARVVIADQQLVLPGDILASVGQSQQVPSDLSEPGLIVWCHLD